MKPLALSTARRLTFQEVDAGGDAEAAAVWWDRNAGDYPDFFNGPLVACRSCEPADDGSVGVQWYRTSYAHYLQRLSPEPVTSPARALFCSVAVQSRSGHLVLGEMSASTTSPLRLQLPGGNLSMPGGAGLSLAQCATDACRELGEETGLRADQSSLRLWRVKHGGEHDDVGIMFHCSLPQTTEEIRRVFEDHQDALRSAGDVPEFANLIFVEPGRPQWEERPRVDYLEAVALALAEAGD